MGKLIKLNPTELAFCGGASSFLQSDFWGSFKARFGWKPYPFSAEWEAADDSKEKCSLPLLVLYRRLGFGIGFAYVPWGPELPAGYDAETSLKASAELAEALRTFLPKETTFIRFDFPWFIDNSQSIKKPFTRAAANVQPPDSVFVDLVPNETAILGAMKSKWRYNIGLAGKKGVNVRCVTAGAIAATGEADDLASYYTIYKETAERDGISIHGMDYYRVLFEEAAKHGIDVRLYMASHADATSADATSADAVSADATSGDGAEDIAGIVTLFRGKEAVYLYGASSNHKRNLMAPYALQWKAMQDAKTSGCCYYDMFGIPPKPPEDDPNHPMAGLYRFKTGFIDTQGGKIIHRPGSWDYNLRPAAKALYSTAEKTRKKIWDLKKRLKRR